MNTGNLLDGLPVRRVIDRAEIKGRPFREQRVRGSKRRIVNCQKTLKFVPAFLQFLQPRRQLTLTLIVSFKVLAALFTFKQSNGWFALHAVQPDRRDIDSKSRLRSTNLHCATTETTVTRPNERMLLQASVQFRFTGGHDLFLVTVFRKAVRSAEKDRDVIVESSVEINSWKLGDRV